MKTQRNILFAFILNLSFAIFEFVGGAITGSVAIISDAVHDLGDAAGIGISYFLERKSKKKPDQTHTYGYARYSVVGSAITTLILLCGSVTVVYNAALRIADPVPINYDGMILFALVGVVVNFSAAWLTKNGDSLNQKAVNLHMLEDVLGWVVVLLGAVIMRFTDVSILDPLMSMGVALFILVNGVKNLVEVVGVFTDKLPEGVDLTEIKEHLCRIEGVQEVHHIHIRSLDGYHNCASMHIVTDDDAHEIKAKVREELREHGIDHVTLELEGSMEHCSEKNCHVEFLAGGHGHHNHHHHH